jgi:hypothetical protein
MQQDKRGHQARAPLRLLYEHHTRRVCEVWRAGHMRAVAQTRLSGGEGGRGPSPWELIDWEYFPSAHTWLLDHFVTKHQLGHWAQTLGFFYSLQRRRTLLALPPLDLLLVPKINPPLEEMERFLLDVALTAVGRTLPPPLWCRLVALPHTHARAPRLMPAGRDGLVGKPTRRRHLNAFISLAPAPSRV